MFQGEKRRFFTGQNQFQRCESKQRKAGVEMGLGIMSPVPRELGMFSGYKNLCSYRLGITYYRADWSHPLK